MENMGLKEELALPAYTGKTDAECAAMLNAPIVVGRRYVPLTAFVYLLFSDATWAALQNATQSADANLKAAAVTVYDYLRNPHVATIDMDLPATRYALAGLVAAGVMAQSLVDEIDAMANVTATRATQLRAGVISEAIVAAARGTS